jgi:clan AA aspartic protease
MERGKMVGTTYAEITLKNEGDVFSVSRGYIKEPEIRQTTVRALVDTGAITLVINEEMRQQLGLGVMEQRETTFANGAKALCKMTEPVAVLWKDRSAVCRALVTSEKGETLLGAIPLEDMDLMVNPVDQELVGIHGDKPVSLVM